MQKFILFLGHPVYSVTWIIFSMLIFAGLGSRASQKINLSAIWLNCFIFALIISFLLFYAFFLTSILAIGQGLPLWGRQIFIAFLTGILAFFMGMPFPLGTRLWAEKAPNLVPWGWSVNSCTSVLGAIFPVIIALGWGFQKVFFVAAFLYGLSCLAFKEIQLQKK